MGGFGVNEAAAAKAGERCRRRRRRRPRARTTTASPVHRLAVMLVSTLMALMVTEIAVKVPHVRYSTCMCVFVRVFSCVCVLMCSGCCLM